MKKSDLEKKTDIELLEIIERCKMILAARKEELANQPESWYY